jgi:nicotinamide riboside kinase
MKIGFCGTMSVGKSTLVNALSELPQFEGYHFATERSKYLRDLGIPLNTDSTLKGQTIFLAERCTELLYDKMITDRTVIDVMAFTLNASSIFYNDKHKFENYAKLLISEYDYIFYVSPEGVEIEDNGVRETNSEYRQTIDKTINYIINAYKPLINKFTIISGTTDERVQKVLETIKF